MFSYIALVWDDSDASQREAAAQASQRIKGISPDILWLHQSAGLQVYGTPSTRNARIRTFTLTDGRGVIFGNLFPRDLSRRAEIRASEDLVAVSGYHALAARYFGRYIAFFTDPDTRCKRICRDPTGGMHCFQLRHRQLHVFVRRLADFEKYFGGEFSVNWRYVKGHLLHGSLQLKETALREVTEVQPGECLTFDASGSSSHFFWNPLQIAFENPVRDLNSAVEQLRDTTRACVAAWASCHDSIIHMLSGGVDSSIVLSCFSGLEPVAKITCINYFSKGADTDERSYARLAVAEAGCELVEQERQFQSSLRGLLSIPKSPYPYSYIGYLTDGRRRAKFAHERDASAIFSGHGGDTLFYAAYAGLAAADYLFEHRFAPSVFKIALDVAPLAGMSVWRVLGDAFKQVYLGRSWNLLHETDLYRFMIDRSLIDEVKADSSLIHTLFRDTGAVPSGKRYQAYGLTYMMTPRYDPFEQSDDPDEVSPLLSQPLVELCLRIPTYLLTHGGRDRDIARRAFARLVPREIILRKTKGGMEEDVKRNLTSNLQLVREMLLDGELVRRGFLVRRRLEEALTTELTSSRSFPLELYGYLHVEAWLQSWPEAMRGAAA